MPLYEYRCGQCDRVVEVLQKVGARGPRKCKHCSGKMEKIVSRSAFHLKGGGWFSEGYTGGDSKPKAPKPKTDGSTSGAKKEKKEKKQSKPAVS